MESYSICKGTIQILANVHLKLSHGNRHNQLASSFWSGKSVLSSPCVVAGFLKFACCCNILAVYFVTSQHMDTSFFFYGCYLLKIMGGMSSKGFFILDYIQANLKKKSIRRVYVLFTGKMFLFSGSPSYFTYFQ